MIHTDCRVLLQKKVFRMYVLNKSRLQGYVLDNASQSTLRKKYDWVIFALLGRTSS